jgi:hypothetical protein
MAPFARPRQDASELSSPREALLEKARYWAVMDQLASPELKNVAKLPATAVTTKMAHASRHTSITFPAGVSGLVILDEMVSNCTEQKKAASPSPWMSPPFRPFSNTHMRTVPTAKTAIDMRNAISRRANSRRCRSPTVNSLDNSSRITAESPSALRGGAGGVGCCGPWALVNPGCSRRLRVVVFACCGLVSSE